MVDRHEFERSDYGLHGRVKERRFDLPEQPAAATTPMQTARVAYDSLPDAEQDTLQSWIKDTIKPAAPRPGWSQFDPQPSGTLYTDDLAAQAGVSIPEINGALLAAGYLPTRSSAYRQIWAIGAEYK